MKKAWWILIVLALAIVAFFIISRVVFKAATNNVMP
jgi:hypothetical protein